MSDKKDDEKKDDEEKEEEPEEEAPYMLIMDAGTITLDRLHVLRHNQGIEIKADLRLWNISC